MREHAWIALPLLLCGGCATSWKEVRREPSYAPTPAAAIRVAAPPFRDETGGRSPLLYPVLPLVWIANIALLRVPEDAPPSSQGAESLRSLLVARLQGTSLGVVDPRAVDTTLHHLDLLDRAHETDPVELGRILGVDAVLLGTLRTWEPRYYGVETRTVVEAEVTLVSCADRSELLRATVGVTDGAGLSGGPTGYVSAASAPLAALGGGPYRPLSIEWSERMAAELLGSPQEGSLAEAPYIAVAAVSTPPPGGFRTNDVVEVFALGAPGCRASFDLGTLRVRVPMCETARVPRTGDRQLGEISAHYRGSYAVTEADRLLDAPVVVNLESAGGRASAFAENGRVTIPGSGGQSPEASPPRRGSE